MTKRYTAIVEILEVTETPDGKDYGKVVPGDKTSRELAKLVIRDENLLGLKDKLQAHIELV